MSTLNAQKVKHASSAVDNITLDSTGKATLGGQLDLGSIGQIKFPATQNASADANTLDDYEEGTWTPAVNLLGTLTYSTATGKYQKVGKYVRIIFGIAVSSTDTTQDSSALLITNLPFTSGSVGGQYTAGSTAVCTENLRGTASPSGQNTFHVMPNASSTEMVVMQNNYNATLSNKSWFGSNLRSGYNGAVMYIVGQIVYEATN